MRRTLQTLLLVAAVTSAPLAALANPSAADPPRQERRSFIARILDQVKAATMPAPAPEATAESRANPLPRLPRWISELLDLDDARSTGS